MQVNLFYIKVMPQCTGIPASSSWTDERFDAQATDRDIYISVYL